VPRVRTGVHIDVDVHDAIEGVELVEAKLAHLEIPLADIALLWSEHIGYLFATAPWPGLKASTLAIKAEQGYPSDPLVRTSGLKDATTGGQWQIHGGVGQAVARLGYPRHGIFHVTGFVHHSAGWVPARDWSMLDEPTVMKMVEAFGDYLTEGL